MAQMVFYLRVSLSRGTVSKCFVLVPSIRPFLVSDCKDETISSVIPVLTICVENFHSDFQYMYEMLQAFTDPFF
jgi:hypothetical protein